MKENMKRALDVMNKRFGCDRLVSIATVEGDMPYVRAVNAYYENGSFYVVTNAMSNKMLQLKKNPNIALCGDWFTAHGIGVDRGHVLKEENAELMTRLRVLFREWYTLGHVDESDPNTVLLEIKLTNGVLFDHGTRYDIDFGALFGTEAGAE